jgi:hypothetical protein
VSELRGWEELGRKEGFETRPSSQDSSRTHFNDGDAARNAQILICKYLYFYGGFKS